MARTEDYDLRALVEALTSPPTPARTLGNALVDLNRLLPRSTPQTNSLSGIAGLFALTPPTARTSPPDLTTLGNALTRPVSINAFGRRRPSPVQPPVAYFPSPIPRRVFFSFHFDDVLRVNNVRNIMKFQKGTAAVDVSFYDRSLWEKSKRTNPENLKRLIRDGVKSSSVICVLVGTETWSRPWVRYEIARSVIDGKGLLAVHINGITHHQYGAPHPLGPEPLMQMAVGKMRDGTYRLFEGRNGGWYRYEEHMQAVSLPRYLAAPEVDKVAPLGTGAFTYDFARENGAKNVGQWIALAATHAGR